MAWRLRAEGHAEAGDRPAAIAEPDFIKRRNDLGSNVVSKDKATPEGLRTHLKAEIDKWGPIIKKAGVYAD